MELSMLHVENLTQVFLANGAKTRVLDHLTLTVRAGEFLSVLGRSGCGKSTLLNLLAGFLQPTGGRILADGRPVERPGPDRCVVFQEDALFPWLTVAENIAFGLGNLDAVTRKRQVDQSLDMVGLAPFKDYLPREISGGMKQRVALARVLVLRPKILLMDEPFGALDAQTREEMQALLLSLWQELSQTVVFVTHDVREAVFLADRVLVMDRPDRPTVMDIDLSRPRTREDEGFSAWTRRLRSLLSLA